MSDVPTILNHIRRTSTRTFIIALTVAGLLVAAGTYGIGHRVNDNGTESVALSALDTSIESTKNKLLASPKSATLMINLCRDYLQKVRETADTAYYTKCDGLLKKAIALDPMNADVVATQSALAYGRHDFNKGLALAQSAVSLNPNRPAYYGLLGDGQIELGQYDLAVSSFQTMINKRPDLSSYNRVAYVREIYGDISGAKTALNSAIASGSSFPENVAYSQVELGKLYARTDLGKAEQAYKQALTTYKDFPPALEGLGKVAVGHKDYAKAVSYFSQAFTALPLAQYSNDLADTYTLIRDKTKASQQYYLSDLAFQKSSSGGVNNDFEKSVYLTNQGRDLFAANKLAQKAVADRPNLFSFDALAWNQYKMGNYSEAQSTITNALKVGSTEPVVLFHAGMIAAKLGQNDDAKMYLQKAFAADRYFLESHFSLLDKQTGEQALRSL